MAKDIIRRVRFSPYRRGVGPSFSLTMWDTGRTDSRGQTVLGYELKQSNVKKPIFRGEDFSGSPGYADDSDNTVATLMEFLTLKPGDTDSEYFEDYTPAQLKFASEHGEALNMEVINRFGET